MTEEIFETLQADLEETLRSLERDLARIRTGRANPGLLDGVMVDYYGTPTMLNKLATVSAPEARLLLVQPFDQGAIAGIEKAIVSADLGLNPSSDGKLIRVPVPELTGERRKEMVKQVGKEAETHRISARNHRRDANDMLKELHSEKELSDDDLRTAQGRVQELTDACVKKIDDLARAKETEVLAV
ncbi:MAG: ribosome recycling factor [Candidatus Binatia bacterium]